MKLMCLVILLGCLSFAQTPVVPPPKPFNTFLTETVYPSVYTVYTQQSDGGYKMVCTTTAFESKPVDKKTNKIRFASAGHCIPKLPEGLKALFGAVERKATYFVAQDDAGSEKTYFRAEIVARGDVEAGEDFSVFEVETKKTVAVVPLGEDPMDSIDQPVVNIANPLGLGTQVFRGYVSRTFYDRHDGPIGSDWYGNLLLQMLGVDGGSSGSAVICEKQRAICGFVVGYINNTVVATPVSRFKKWYTSISKPKVPSLFNFGYPHLFNSYPGFSPPPKEPLRRDPWRPFKSRSQGQKQ